MTHVLIVAEKPDAAKRIAQALDAKQQPKKSEINHVPYYTAKRDSQIVVVPAIGHLYTVAAKGRGKNKYPVFTFEWQPRYLAEQKAKHVRRYIESFRKLSQDADGFIDACDYDGEGSLIGYMILKHACGEKQLIAKRMKYSTLTANELEKAYETLLPHLDFDLIEAGRARHEVDWLFGINLTRALTSALRRNSGQYMTLSTGRVQGPTLKFLGLREKSIQTFVPVPYWTIRAKVKIDEQIFEAIHEKEKIDTEQEAETILSTCKGRDGIVEKVDVKLFQQAPPPPFDLGTLQSEAYSMFGYSPKETSDIAQHLYLDALISYPRTGSQKLPAAIGYEAILSQLSKIQEYRRLSTELLAKPMLIPTEGRKDDLAHPAIHPTGELPTRALSSQERRILDLIVRRFMAVFAEPATKQSTKVIIKVNDNHFHLRGVSTLKEGWVHFYAPYARSEEIVLPTIKEGQSIHIIRINSEEKFTSPPPRYNPRSLLNRMEKTEIGTKATRADIIQTLYNRKYIKNERMVVTELGFEILEILEEYCPTVISIKLTRELEGKMNSIQSNSKNRQKILRDTVEKLKPIMRNIKEKEGVIGEQLAQVTRESRLEERIIGPCPTCHTGRLITIHSRKTGKRFIGCTNYFKGLCTTSFPLPQQGTLRLSGGTCHACNWPTIQVRSKGRRSWTLCFNPQCQLMTRRQKRIEMQNMR
ncbi:MAG TPA: DNA topoisomerase I [Candidatus Acidoferrum sp.]|nr:DNA topoisomerase I [Candidatus Acidoferrum sp.]